MRRLVLAVAVAVVAVLIAAPVSAQYDGTPPPAAPEQIRQTTQCGVIIISGDNWGEGTVTIVREFEGECPGIADPEPENLIEEGINGGADADPDGRFADAAPSTEEQIEVAVADDGSFRATLLVPSEVDTDTYEVTVTGQDLSGQAKEQVYAYDVTPASLFTPDVEPTTDNRTTYAIVALLLASVLLVGLNWSPIMRRVRR